MGAGECGEESASESRDCRWEERAGLPGVPYRFAIENEGEIEGVALRIAPGGALIVRTDGGERTVELADARVVRPS